MSDGPTPSPAALERAAAILAGEATLSPAAAELAAAILATEEPEAPAIAPGALARFAIGLCPEDERRRTTAALTRSRDLRRTLVRLHAEYAAWARDPQAARPEGWREALRGAMAALREPGRVVRERILRAVAAEAAEGFALARDAGGRPGLDPLLGDLAEVSYEGGAVAVRERAPGVLGGAALRLDLLDPGGGALTLATGRVEGGTWRVDAPSDVAPGRLRVSVADADDMEAPRSLFASVAGSPETVRIGLVEGPRLKNGRLRLALAIPDEVRAAYPDHALSISLPLGNLEMRLATWLPPAWTAGTTVLEAEVLEATDGPLPYGSVIALELEPAS